MPRTASYCRSNLEQVVRASALRRRRPTQLSRSFSTYLTLFCHASLVPCLLCDLSEILAKIDGFITFKLEGDRERGRERLTKGGGHNEVALVLS